MTAFLDLLQSCPLDACNHSLAMHEQHDSTRPPTCRADGCRCTPEDLADEEWS